MKKKILNVAAPIIIIAYETAFIVANPNAGPYTKATITLGLLGAVIWLAVSLVFMGGD